MNQFAPVLITTLNRVEHLRNCIESLRCCSDANETEVLIGVDYPPSEAYLNGYDEVCEYVKTIKGFKAVHYFFRSENVGQFQNTKMLRDLLPGMGYDRFILSEDDITYSPNFLRYMNSCLQRYEHDPKVHCICAYSYRDWTDFGDYDRNVFPFNGFCAWGVANWIGKLEEYYQFPDISELINSWRFVFKMFRFGHYVTIHRIISRLAAGKEVGGDVCRRLFLTSKSMYAIFPVVSKVRNNGFDGSGERCAVIDSYSRQLIDGNHDFVVDNVEVEDYGFTEKFFKLQYTGGFLTRFSAVLEYLMFRMTGKGFRSFSILTDIMRKRAK